MERVINNLAEMEHFAQEERERLFADMLKRTSATVVGLSGELGAGKTAFVKAFAKALGITESVTSPTFVLARFYAIPGHSRVARLVHIDAYRIASPEELHVLRWEALLADPLNLILVEWQEHLGELFPKGSRVLYFEVESETIRKIHA